MKSSRNSNIEALRLVSMFLILMLHVNFFTIGEPSTKLAIEKPVPTLASCFFESISLISVNLFVLISGWFSIKFSLRRLMAFVFQCVFLITLIYIIGLCLGFASLNEQQILECFFLAKHGWYIKAYIGLMLLAPALNYFVECSSRRQFEIILICFFTFQTIYSCLVGGGNGAQFINMGYSTFSFVGLYLLARYVKLYGKSFVGNAGKLFLISLAGYFLWMYLPVRLGVMRLFYMTLPYTNPMNILFALSVLLLVVRIKPVSNKIINAIAASTFAVYLCHMCNTWTCEAYKEVAMKIYISYTSFGYLIAITLFMLSVFVASILLDQPRKWVWKMIEGIYPPPLTNVNIIISCHKSLSLHLFNEESRHSYLSRCA